MSDKKKEISAQSRHEDEVLLRALLWIGGAAVLIMILLLANRFFINYRSDEIELAYRLIKVLSVAGIVGVAAGVACGAMAWLAHKKETVCKWWVTLSVFFGVFGVMMLLVRNFRETGVQIMCTLLPGAAILALVYYLFQREFFVIALSSGLGMLGLWMIRKLSGGHPAALYVILAVLALALVVIALFARQVQNGEGLWKGRRVLSKNAAYPMIYASCGISAVLMVIGLFAGSLVFYLMFPAVAWLVVMAVYFTVKLM